ncbi:MAG: ACP S-malonyltransferase [Rhodospirillales bacterium]
MARAFVFPGQGSQAVGMGQALAEAFAPAREVFEEVDEALQQNLFRLMVEGPSDTLTLTENTQPALMAVSLAVVRVIEREGGVTLADKGAFVAGHSLGEYSALAAAGCLEIAAAARLLRQRGAAMQAACPPDVGAMAAVMGLDIEAIEAVAAEAAQGQVCSAANDNSPNQVVISGHREAVLRAMDLAKEKGGRRSQLLPVSAPFHCALMAPAADVMEEALEGSDLAPPALPLIANVTAAPVTAPSEIRRLLVQQVTGRVRWRESVLAMQEAGVVQLIELGQGKVLSGLARRIHPDLEGHPCGTPEDIEAFLATL